MIRRIPCGSQTGPTLIRSYYDDVVQALAAGADIEAKTSTEGTLARACSRELQR